jgi:hypothetical protein
MVGEGVGGGRDSRWISWEGKEKMNRKKRGKKKIIERKIK